MGAAFPSLHPYQPPPALNQGSFLRLKYLAPQIPGGAPFEWKKGGRSLLEAAAYPVALLRGIAERSYCLRYLCDILKWPNQGDILGLPSVPPKRVAAFRSCMASLAFPLPLEWWGDPQCNFGGSKNRLLSLQSPSSPAGKLLLRQLHQEACSARSKEKLLGHRGLFLSALPSWN